MNEGHYRYTYELADEFTCFPTNAVTIAHSGPWTEGDFDIPGMPEFNPMKLLHGEESVIVHKPLKPNTNYVI